MNQKDHSEVILTEESTETFLKHQENAARRHVSDFPLSKRLKFFAGRFAGILFQRRKQEVSAAPFANDSSGLNRLIRNGIYSEAFEKHDHHRLREYFSHYWGKEAAAFHEGWNDRFERMFLSHDVRIIDELESLIGAKDQKDRFKHIYEIGCGGGQVLNYLHDRFTQVETFTGIDLGETQIQKNRNENEYEFLRLKQPTQTDGSRRTQSSVA